MCGGPPQQAIGYFFAALAARRETIEGRGLLQLGELPLASAVAWEFFPCY
jgi:hypothetical protein